MIFRKKCLIIEKRTGGDRAIKKVKSYKIKLSGVDLNVTIEGLSDTKSLYEKYPIDFLGRHYHAGFEWFFVTESPLLVYTESGPRLYESGVVCIPPHFVHTTNNRDNFKITFSFKCSKEENSGFAGFMNNKFLSKEITTAKIRPRTAIYIQELKEFFSSDQEIAEEKSEALLKLIFSDIFLENAKKVQSGHSKGTGDYLVKIDNIIGDFKSDINLDTVSEALGVCPRQASRIIKKNYGSSLSVLVEKKRLGIAKDLLSSSEMSISEIVDYINFSSVSFFYSRFKKMYGVTPTEYKKAIKANNELHFSELKE